MGRDFYGILGVSKNCSDDELKKAYKKMALKWHPDRWAQKSEAEQKTASEKFKEIAEAYSVLSDAKKRQIYDMYGEDGLKGGMPEEGFGGFGNGQGFQTFKGPHGETYTFSSNGGDFNPFDIFNSMFGEDDLRGFSRGFRSKGRSQQRSQKFNFGGFNGFDGFNTDDSSNSSMYEEKRKAPDVNANVNCTLEELYKGCTKQRKITKTITNEQGMSREKEELVTLNIQPGWKEGTKMTFEGYGDEEPGVEPANVVFTIKQIPHPLYTREGDNLNCTITITLLQALTGIMITLPFLDGSEIKHKITKIVSDNTTEVISGKGMPVRKNPGHYGDLIVHFKVQNPTYLSDQQKSDLKKVLSTVHNWS